LLTGTQMPEPLVATACAAAFLVALLPPAEPGATLFDTPSRVIAALRGRSARNAKEVSACERHKLRGFRGFGVGPEETKVWPQTLAGCVILTDVL